MSERAQEPTEGISREQRSNGLAQSLSIAYGKALQMICEGSVQEILKIAAKHGPGSVNENLLTADAERFGSAIAKVERALYAMATAAISEANRNTETVQ